MIWFIIGLVIAAIIIIKIWLEDMCYVGESISFSIVIFFLWLVVASVLCFGASAITSSCVKIEYDMVSDAKIIALKDNQNVGGNFYVMGGYIDEDLYYYYATETEFGYKTEKIEADNAYIKYTNGETHIERYEGKFASDLSYLWGFPMCDDRYIIYCPEGTVTNEFNIDLE